MDRTGLDSPLVRKGQMTIPEKGRKGLRVKRSDKLQSEVEEYRATVPLHPGIRSLKGILASNKGTGMSFSEIREAAAEAMRPRLCRFCSRQRRRRDQ
jgi:bifunctional DNA-binding transcriptional regulator/antitoxin component of YhaV-PrlF toxin-antitoxin module